MIVGLRGFVVCVDKKHCGVLYGDMDLGRDSAGQAEPGSKRALPPRPRERSGKMERGKKSFWGMSYE